MKTRNILTISGITLSLSCTLAATTIFQDDFNGSTANLDAASTDVGGGTWVASPMFDRNGNVNITNGGAGSATLAFTPVDGLIYTAEASYTLSTGGSGDYIGFGFANGQSNATAIGNRFTGALTNGRAWMLARENTNNPRTYTVSSNTDASAWTGFLQSPSDLDLRIVLDTTAGTGAWTATWFAKAAASSAYTEVSASTVLANETINSVGFTSSEDGVTANITNFSLTSAVPEPSTTALLGLGGLALILRRKK